MRGIEVSEMAGLDKRDEERAQRGDEVHHFQAVGGDGFRYDGEAAAMVDGAERVPPAVRRRGDDAISVVRGGGGEQREEIVPGQFRHVAGGDEVPIGLRNAESGQQTADGPEAGHEIGDNGKSEGAMAVGIADDDGGAGGGENLRGDARGERLPVEGKQRLVHAHSRASTSRKHEARLPHERIITLGAIPAFRNGIGKNLNCGYNRIKHKALFCFLTVGFWMASTCADSPKLSARDNPPAGGLASVVRVDAKTGRLVRVTRISPGGGMKAPVPTVAVDALVQSAARSHDVDPLLVHSVIQAESAFRPLAVSAKGAEGLMQLMPATARRFGVSDVFDPQENIEGGVKYLKYLRDLFQDDRLAIAAYNAGEGAVAKYKGVPPYRETAAYVDKVSRGYDLAKKAAGKSGAAPKPAPEEDAYRQLASFYDAQGLLHMTTQ